MAENDQGDPTSEMIPLMGDVNFCCHFWNYGVSEKQQVKALVVVYHGYVQYIEGGCIVYCIMPSIAF